MTPHMMLTNSKRGDLLLMLCGNGT